MSNNTPAGAPSGTIALVFTDIQASTPLWERFPTEMAAALDAHNEIMRALIASHSGYEVKTEGDAFMVAFQNPRHALTWCLAAQAALLAAEWPAPILSHPAAEPSRSSSGVLIFQGPRVRMGIHWGGVETRLDPTTHRADYFGPTVNKAARVGSAAHGGQVLITAEAWDSIQAAATSFDAEIRDLGFHRLKGITTETRLYQVGPRALAERRFRPIRTESARATNLPPLDANFVGRAAALAELDTLLRSRVHLTTIVGPGGIGKTRILQEFGTRHIDDFGSEGGVWFCDLTETKSLDGLCANIANVLGIQLRTDKAEGDLVGQISRALSGRGPCLLLLDNFEQIIEWASASVGVWLNEVGNVQFFISSQVALKLTGERVCELQPLSLPDPDASYQSCEAVEFFLQKAKVARPSFQLTPHDHAAIRDIVTRLDGVPLAIELAASRVKVLSPVQLLERLPKRLDLLASGRRDVTARQATLRGAIDWSWNLLQEHERVALAQCAVFRNGFSLEAAEAVVDLSDFPDAPWTLDVVQTLRERSLLRLVETADSVRFSLYESVRQFAEEKLRAMTRFEGASLAHASFYARWGIAQSEEAYGASGLSALNHLGAELENLIAANEWALKAGTEHQPLALEAALGASCYFSHRGPVKQHVALLSNTISLASDDHDLLKARVYQARGMARKQQGLTSQSQSDLEKALFAAEKHQDHALIAEAQMYLGWVESTAGHEAEAISRMTTAMEYARRAGNIRLLGNATGNLGTIHHRAGRIHDALTAYERAAEILSDGGFRTSAAIFISNIGVIRVQERQHGAARAAFEQARSISHEFGERRREAVAGGYLAATCHDACDFAGAREAYLQALPLLRESGDQFFEGLFRGYLGVLHHELGETLHAEVAFTESIAILSAIGDTRLAALFRGFLGGLKAEEDLEKATALIAAAEAELAPMNAPFLSLAVELCEGQLDVVRARQTGDNNLLSTARGRAARAKAGSPSAADQSDEVRMALRLLEAALPAGPAP